MKNLLLLFIFAPIGVFAQGSLNVNPNGKTIKNSHKVDKKKPIRIETEEGVREYTVQPKVIGANPSVEENSSVTIPDKVIKEEDSFSPDIKTK